MGEARANRDARLAAALLEKTATRGGLTRPASEVPTIKAQDAVTFGALQAILEDVLAVHHFRFHAPLHVRIRRGLAALVLSIRNKVRVRRPAAPVATA
jgi:hypothetical protein